MKGEGQLWRKKYWNRRLYANVSVVDGTQGPNFTDVAAKVKATTDVRQKRSSRGSELRINRSRVVSLTRRYNSLLV